MLNQDRPFTSQFLQQRSQPEDKQKRKQKHIHPIIDDSTLNALQYSKWNKILFK